MPGVEERRAELKAAPLHSPQCSPHPQSVRGPWGRAGRRTHHGERHELQDAAVAALLQAVHALLHEPLHKLRVSAGRLGAQDGGDEQEEVCCGDRELSGQAGRLQQLRAQLCLPPWLGRPLSLQTDPSSQPAPSSRLQPTLPSTLFRGSLMLTACSWEADRELLIERSVGEKSVVSGRGEGDAWSPHTQRAPGLQQSPALSHGALRSARCPACFGHSRGAQQG